MRRSIFIVAIGVFFATAVFNQAYATASCTASVYPHSVTTYNQSGYTFSIHNSGDEVIQWLRIERPSTNFQTDDFSMPGQNIGAGEDFEFTTSATTGSSEAPVANWTLRASTDPEGAAPFLCTGDLGTAIEGQGTDTFPPSISNVGLSNISDVSVTITWTTDENANSLVLFGTTSNYGSQKTDSTLTTSHSLTLDGLSANTTYHYDVRSTDNVGNTSSTGDLTFNTAIAGASATPTTVHITTTVTVTPAPTPTATPVPTPIPDTKPPTVIIATDFTKPYLEAPEVSGTTSDEKGVATVEYSVDNGNHWFPIDQQFEYGSKEVKFTFTPLGLLDGNYAIKIKAKDINNNVRTSDAVTLIIDRLPPRLGGSIFSIGSLLLTPQADGVIYTVKGLSPQVTFSAVGGPILSSIFAGVRAFPLEKLADTGLWSTKLTFDFPGPYDLSSHVVDGVNNTTDQKVGRVQVLKSGKIIFDGKPVPNAVITVYVLNQNTFEFVPWDGKSFGQANPQASDSKGEYALLLPPGTYSIAIEALGLRTLRSDIFTLGQTTPIVQDFTLERRREIQIGPVHIPLFDWFQTQATVETTFQTTEQPQSSLIGKEFPFFDLPGVEGHFSIDDLKGKPTLITVLSTWTPQAPAQMQILSGLQEKESIHTAVIMMHDSQSALQVYAKRGEYTMPMVADSDGVLSSSISVPTLPTHYFLNQRGIVRSIKYGVLSKEEILDGLTN